MFIITFLIVTICLFYVDKNQEQEEKLQASYTAEATISRIESQLNQYLAESHLIKSIVENGNDMSADDFKDIYIAVIWMWFTPVYSVIRQRSGRYLQI